MWAIPEGPFLLQLKKNELKKIEGEKTVSKHSMLIDQIPFHSTKTLISVWRNHQSNHPILTYSQDGTNPSHCRTYKETTLSSFLPNPAIFWLCLQLWNTTTENLEPLILSGDAFNPSFLPKTIFKMNFFDWKICFLPCSAELPFGFQALDTVVYGLPELGPHGEVI